MLVNMNMFCLYILSCFIIFFTEPKEDKPSIPEFIKIPEKVVARERDLAQFIVKVFGTPKPTG